MGRFVNWVYENDQRALFLVNQQMRCKVFDVILPRITHLGGATFTLGSLFLLIMVFKESIRLWSLEALLSLSLSHVVVHFIKKIYCRPRPYSTIDHINLCANPLKDYSFPSGHTTAAFSIAMVFSLHSIVLVAILLPLALIISFSRMYLGLHYPTDCIIGALLGTGSSILVVYASQLWF